MASLYGVHAANGGEDIAENVIGLGVSHSTLLHLQAGVAHQLYNGLDGYLHIRFYLTSWSKRDPLLWAAECANEAIKDRGDGWSLLGASRVLFSFANEMNLSDEGGGWTEEWYQRIDAWLTVVSIEFRRLTGCPKSRLMWPALACGHGEDEIGYPNCTRSLSEHGVLGVHPYWYTPDQVSSEFYGRRYVKAHEAAPNMPIFISESGNFAVERASTPDEIIRGWNLQPDRRN